MKACGGSGVVHRLHQTHIEIIEKGFQREILVTNTLVDTHGICGGIKEAQNIFNALSCRGYCILECNYKRVWNKARWIYGCPMLNQMYAEIMSKT